MYYIYTIKDSVSIPPKYIGEDITKSTTEILRNKYERTFDKELGIVLVVFNVQDIGEGVILPSDPNTHHEVTFNVLTFSLEVEEIVAGEVSELADFGIFLRSGPVDGLVHLSQITNDFMGFDRRTGTFTSRASKKSIKKGDSAYAKVSTVSTRHTIQDIKVALTMRPEGLGKADWIKEDKIRAMKEKRKK